MIKRINLGVLLLLASLSGFCLADAGEETLFKEAQDYYARGETKAAIIQLKNLLKTSPLNGEARLLLGQVYITLGDGLSAVKELEKAKDLHLNKDKWVVPLGRAYLLSGKPAEVLAEIGTDGDLPQQTRAEVHVLRGIANLAKANIEQAEADFNAALDLEQEKPEALLGLARIALKNKNLEVAIQYTQKVVTKKPDNVDAWILLGESQRLSGKIQNAVESFGRAIALHAGNMPARLGRATALISLKQVEKAQEDVNRIRADYGDISFAMYLHGLIAFQKGELAIAEESLQQVLGTLPDHLPSQLLMGTLNYRKGDLERAEKNLANFHQAVPQHLPATKLLAAILMKQGQPGKALAVLEPAIKESEKDPQLLALLGSAYMQNKQYDKGTEYLGQAAKLAPDVAAIQTQLALGHIATGQMDQAVGELEQAVDLGQNLVQADIMLVAALIQKKDYDKAIDSAKRLQEKMPGNPMPDNLIAAAHLAKGDKSQARNYWRHALKVKPDYATASMNLAKLELQEGKTAEAISYYQTVLKDHPDHLGALIGLARTAEKQGKYDNMVEWLENARETNPEALQPPLMLANYNLLKNQPLKALDLARTVNITHPDNPSVLRILGIAQQAAGKNASAVSTFKKLVANTTNSAEAYHLLARARFAGGDVDRAASEWDRALRIDPNYLPATVARTEYDIKKKQFQEGLTRSRQIQKTYPEKAVGYQLEGSVEFAQKNYASAVKAYRKAFEIAPNSRSVKMLYQAYRKEEDRGNAQALLEEWLTQHDRDTGVRTLLAMDYQSAGSRAKAISAYEKALAQAPDSVVVVNNLAWLYQETGNPKALAFAEKLLSLAGDNPETVDTAGWVLMNNGKVKRALVLLQQAVIQAPHIASIRFHLAEAYVKTGRQADARKELTRLLEQGKPFPERVQAESLLKKL